MRNLNIFFFFFSKRTLDILNKGLHVFGELKRVFKGKYRLKVKHNAFLTEKGFDGKWLWKRISRVD